MNANGAISEKASVILLQSAEKRMRGDSFLELSLIHVVTPWTTSEG